MAPFFVRKSKVAPFFIRLWPPNLILRGTFTGSSGPLSDSKVVPDIIDKYNQKTVGQVILRWLTQRGVVAIPKSVRKARIVENFTIFDFDLSQEDMAAMRTLDTKTSSFFDHRDPNAVKRLSEATRPT